MSRQKIISLLAKQTFMKKKEVESLLETPPSQDLGDFAFPCFALSKKLKKSPNQIAQDLSKEIKTSKEIEKIQATGPYLNFFINKKILAEQTVKINNNYGRQKQKQKILLEHTSVNPNASPHVGRTRNSIIGDSIYRILTFLGNRVERHYYINDVSKQVAMLALVFKPTDKFNDLLKKYIQINEKVKNNPDLEKQVFDLLHKFEHGDKETTGLFRKIVDTAVKGQKQLFSEIGIEFDCFDYESKYIKESQSILKQLEKTGKTFTDEHGRLILEQKNTPLFNKMKTPVLVLTRGDGTGLYVTRDLAYTIDKTKKGRNIIVLGEDQKLYFEQLKEALKLLNKPSPEVIHYSFVLLKGIGKMSTRRGELVLLKEFLDYAEEKAEQGIRQRKTKGDSKKVAIAAVKYSMLKNENNKNITFDLQDSLNFEGNTGPYLQYSYARASSILRKAKKTSAKLITPKNLNKSEIQLLTIISRFPEIVERAGEQLNPSLIANYSYELAKSFNEFYHACRVIGDKNEGFRLKLIQSFRITLKNSLYLLGIDVMEEM